MDIDEFDHNFGDHFESNFDNDAPESLERTRRIALLCGIAGGVMMTISILGLMF